jgi:catechol 2,3-dioxygenase-like lactoylglutathione lyase family enzyme
MQLSDSYPVIITDSITECRDFYVRWFSFEVLFEASWFVLLTGSGERTVSLAFMRSDHPSTPPSPGVYRGDGMFLTFQVEDARAEYGRLIADGMSFALELTDEPWGQRRFAVIDPAGMWLDVVQQIEPAQGWWGPYLGAPSA